MFKTSRIVYTVCKCGREIHNTAIVTVDGETETVSFPAPKMCIACAGNPNEKILDRRALGNMRHSVGANRDYRLTIATKV